MRFLADENFNGRILRGLLRQNVDIDVVRVQDTPLFQANDPVVLEWAAQENRILLTHDVNTITKHAFERVVAGLPMPGIVEIIETMPIGQAIEELLILIGASDPAEWENQIVYLPMR